MKKGINQWLFPDTMNIRECMLLAKDAGFDGIELCLAERHNPSKTQEGKTLDEEAGIGGYSNVEFALDTPNTELEKIARLAKDIGIEICSVATALNFRYSLSDPEPAVREKGIRVIEKAIESASTLGTKMIILIPGMVTEKVTYIQAFERARSAINGLIKVARKYRVYMGIENVWNKFLLSPVEFRDFVDGFGSEYVCAYFDVGNIVAYGYPEQWIEILGKRIKAVHIKDFKTAVGNINGFTEILQGDVAWPEVMRAFCKIEYEGYLTVESIPHSKFYPERLIFEASRSFDKLIEEAKKIQCP